MIKLSTLTVHNCFFKIFPIHLAGKAFSKQLTRGNVKTNILTNII